MPPDQKVVSVPNVRVEGDCLPGSSRGTNEGGSVRFSNERDQCGEMSSSHDGICGSDLPPRPYTFPRSRNMRRAEAPSPNREGRARRWLPKEVRWMETTATWLGLTYI